MEHAATTSCANCRRLEVRVGALQAEVASLRDLLAAARKDSTTSSEPPSSDIVEPQPAPNIDGTTRSIGGQPGHPMHRREPFPAGPVTHFEEHTPAGCPCCGGPVHRNGHLARVVQQVDVTKPPLAVEQHTSPEYWCAHCRRGFQAPMPAHVAKGGRVGLERTALIAVMKGACHASFSAVRTFLRDVVGVTVSRSVSSTILGTVSAALEKPYAELLLLLPQEDALNADGTGHKDNGARWWTWCFRAELYTLYHIDAHRSADVLMDVLGKGFKGVLGCDDFSAYRRYMRACGIRAPFRLAHLIRDVKFLTTRPDERDRRYGEELRAALKNLFEVFHQHPTLAEGVFRARLQAARDRVLRIGRCGPPTRHGQNRQKRFTDHGSAYFTLVTTPGVEPTNNLAEQAIRFVVIGRHITQGTRSAGGRQFGERIGAVIATCVQQSQSVYRFVRESVRSWWEGTPPPSLLASAGNG